MPTFLICGDPHGEFQHIRQELSEKPVNAVILLGDLDLHEPLHTIFRNTPHSTSLHWIPGNHDTDNEVAYNALFMSELAGRNLHGRIVDIEGVRVAGLGGVFRSRVWDGETVPIYQSQEEFIHKCGKGNLWHGGLPLRHRSTIFPSDIAAFCGHQADLLVTLEAPALHRHAPYVRIDVASGNFS